MGKKFYNACNVPRRNEAARILLKDYIKGKTVYCHHPPTMTAKQKYLFYHGNILWMNNGQNKEEEETMNEDFGVNVLDQSKLNGNVEKTVADDENEDVDMMGQDEQEYENENGDA